MSDQREPTFTMLYDALADELGLVSAAVLCAALRFCRLSDGVCRAALRTIGQRVHLDKRTVGIALKQLAAAGYLEDLTPGLRNVPHRYRDTGKAAVIIREAQAATVAHDHATVADDHATVAHHHATVAHRYATVAHDPLKRLLRDSQETPEETAEELPAPRRAPAPDAAPELLVFYQAADFMPHKQVFAEVIEAVRRVGQRLGRAATADDLQPFLKAWLGRGWNPYNLGWLYEWAAQGVIPPNARHSAMQDQTRKGQANGNHDLGSDAVRNEWGDLSPEERARLVELYNAPRRKLGVRGV